MSYDITAERLLDEAQDWFDSIDRSGLGAFASDAHVLVVAHALMTADTEKFSRVDMTEVAMSLSTLYAKVMEDAVLNTGIELSTVSRMSYVELFMWWARSGTNLALIGESRYRSIREDGAYLSYLLDNTASRPYFEAGVRDIALIESCIADGIDVQMTISISESRKEEL